MNRLLWTVSMIAAGSTSATLGGEVSSRLDAETGWTIYDLRQGQTRLSVVPAAGCNAFSWQVRDVEYLRVPEKLSQLPGVGFGNPLLYPTPNRIRGAKFSFAGRDYQFPSNGGGNFIHGLVHSVPWDVQATSADGDSASLVCRLDFEPGSERFQLFPWRHTLRMTVTLREASVRWTYEVDNPQGSEPLPFGFAFHPYFVYQGARAQTYLQVPATHWMESDRQLPSGKLVPLDNHPLDARQFHSLANFVLDDVFYGMKTEVPTRVEFRDKQRELVLRASPEFTHLVVYTPENRPFFCIENQTCSTDAHNLHAHGLESAAHLQICPAGQKMSGWVEYHVELP